jgi:hypothetical protein
MVISYPSVICPDIFKKLVESKRNLPWDDAYDYVDDLGICAFKYLNWFLRTYRDELLKLMSLSFLRVKD